MLPENAELKERFVNLQQQNEMLRKEIRNAKTREKRAKVSIKGLLEDLAEKSMINAELELKLASYEGIISKFNVDTLFVK